MISKKIEEIKKTLSILEPLINENFTLLNKAESEGNIKTYVAHGKRRFLTANMNLIILVNELVEIVNNSTYLDVDDQPPEYLSSKLRNSSDPSTREAARSHAYSLYLEKWPELQ